MTLDLEKIKVSHDIVKKELMELKTKYENSKNKDKTFLKDLEYYGINEKYDLNKFSLEDFTNTMYFIINEKIDGDLNKINSIDLNELNKDEKIILSYYIEATLFSGEKVDGFDFIELDKLGEKNQEKILNAGLEKIKKDFLVVSETKEKVSNEKVINKIEEVDEEYKIDKIPKIENSAQLIAFVEQIPKMFGENDKIVFNDESLELLNKIISEEVFYDYFKCKEKKDKENKNLVIALYSMLDLGVESFPLNKNGKFLSENADFYYKKFEKAMKLMENKLNLDVLGGDYKNLEKEIGKKYSKITIGDLGVILSKGENISKYFLYDFGGDGFPDNLSEVDVGDEFIVDFHGNKDLKNNLGLGHLLLSKKGPYITEIEVDGLKAVLKYPPEVDVIGYYHEEGKDKDGDTYAEVYNYSKVKILKISDNIYKKDNYEAEVNSFIDVNRGEDVDNYVEDEILLGNIDISKITIEEVESLKNSGYDISKLFLVDENGERLKNGLSNLEIGKKVKVNIPSKALEKYLSAGLLFAPNFDKNEDSITKIKIDGYEGTLQTGKKGKIGFYGETQDNNPNGFDEKGKYYRAIYDGSIIEIVSKGESKIEKEEYELSNTKINKEIFDDADSLMLTPLTSSKIDKRLLLESVYKKLIGLKGEFSNLIKIKKNELTGNIQYIIKENKYLSQNSETGKIYISSILRKAIRGEEYGDLGEGITQKDFDPSTYEGRFSPPAIVKRWNPTKKAYVTMCGRTWREYRSKFGLKAIRGDADRLAEKFGSPHSGKTKEWPDNSGSTIKAVSDGEEEIKKYAKKNIGKFDFIDIFSEGTSKTGKKLNKRGAIGVGHVASGVVIKGKIYVADPFAKEGLKGKRTEETFIKNGEKIKEVKFGKMQLIPWKTYLSTHNVKRVVFHDAPGINNSIGEKDYKYEKLEGNDKLSKLKNRILRSGIVSKKRHCCGIGVPYNNFEKEGEKILKSIYKYASGSKFEPALILAQMMQESGFSKNAHSYMGASGLMQFMPDTAKDWGVNPNDLDSSVKGAVKYLEWISKKFNSNIKETLWGYNAGQGNIKKIKNLVYYNKGTRKRDEPIKYGNKIINNYKKFKNLGI